MVYTYSTCGHTDIKVWSSKIQLGTLEGNHHEHIPIRRILNRNLSSLHSPRRKSTLRSFSYLARFATITLAPKFRANSIAQFTRLKCRNLGGWTYTSSPSWSFHPSSVRGRLSNGSKRRVGCPLGLAWHEGPPPLVCAIKCSI